MASITMKHPVRPTPALQGKQKEKKKREREKSTNESIEKPTHHKVIFIIFN